MKVKSGYEDEILGTDQTGVLVITQICIYVYPIKMWSENQLV